MGEIGGFSEKTFFDEKRRDSGRAVKRGLYCS